jgi:putative restriction endonuclease
MTTISIGNINYTIVDTKEKITVADSFVKRANKIMTGNGEAKLYLGNDSTEVRDLFGEKGFELKCFLLKKDLLQYLYDSEAEYINPEQPYRNKDQMPQFWRDRLIRVKSLDDIIWFYLTEQTQIAGPRIYVKSVSEAFDLIRELSLPFITYLSAIKLRAPNGDILFYFRLFIDYFGEPQHPSSEREEADRINDQVEIPEEKKEEIRKARFGQGKYRKGVLEECPYCPITLITDDRLLIASHIKPWVRSEENEKLDPKNGFMFTPTYDFLFDRGFITFNERKEMKVSPWLSKVTCSKLNIADDKKYPMLPVEGREDYLTYHNENIFKS